MLLYLNNQNYEESYWLCISNQLTPFLLHNSFSSVRARQRQAMLIYVTHLVPIDGVIMFNRVDFGHRESNSKPHYGSRKGLHSTLLEDLHIGRNGRLIPEIWLCLIVHLECLMQRNKVPSTILWYLHFTWVFPFYASSYFYFTIVRREILCFLLNYIYQL